jgi:serine/threonine protein kinase
MADIYLAGRLDRGREPHLVAIKELVPQLAARPRFVDMFTAEAKIVARLDHPNVTRVEQLGRWAGVPHIIMEYVAGIDLSALLRQCCTRELALPIELRLTILCEVLKGLDHAHRASDDRGEPLDIVHRDVSPSNVLLDFDGKVKLCDFGIAIATSADVASSETIEGKASYMSPEHARGEAVDRRADVFAAGILLWELLSGRRMYRPTESETRIMVAARAQVPVLLVRGLPDEGRLHRIVHKALAEDPDDRYPTVAEMLDDLERWGKLRRMIESTDQLGRWLREHFADLHQARQRTREGAIAALERRAPCPVDLTPGPSEDLSEWWTSWPTPGDRDDLGDDVPTESGARPARGSQRALVAEPDQPEDGLFDGEGEPATQVGGTEAATAVGLMGYAAGAFAAGLALLTALTSLGWL